jgi:hypothetical protein
VHLKRKAILKGRAQPCAGLGYLIKCKTQKQGAEMAKYSKQKNKENCL